LLHYDGSSWSPVTGVSTGTNHLTAIWGSSANDIYVVGWGGTILHYDGSNWSHMASGTQDNLWNVWGDGNGEVFVVGGNIGVGPIALRYPADAATTTTVSGTITTTTTDVEVCPVGELYGENSAQAELLRYVRDNVLSKTPEGQEIIRLYYQLSPAIVSAMEEDEALKEEVKGMIDGILVLIEE